MARINVNSIVGAQRLVWRPSICLSCQGLEFASELSELAELSELSELAELAESNSLPFLSMCES
jgi:hypothetical protein